MGNLVFDILWQKRYLSVGSTAYLVKTDCLDTLQGKQTQEPMFISKQR